MRCRHLVPCSWTTTAFGATTRANSSRLEFARVRTCRSTPQARKCNRHLLMWRDERFVGTRRQSLDHLRKVPGHRPVRDLLKGHLTFTDDACAAGARSGHRTVNPVRTVLRLASNDRCRSPPARVVTVSPSVRPLSVGAACARNENAPGGIS
jgi:hypothetical protein